jgi:hypothetical protein
MKTEKRVNIAIILRNTARYTLLILGIILFTFALLSGSAEYGRDITSIIKNSPNALPWLIFIILVMIAWKWELVGGIIITILSIGMLYYFNFRTTNFFLTTFILTLMIMILSSFFIISWYLRKDKS